MGQKHKKKHAGRQVPPLKIATDASTTEGAPAPGASLELTTQTQNTGQTQLLTLNENLSSSNIPPLSNSGRRRSSLLNLVGILDSSNAAPAPPLGQGGRRRSGLLNLGGNVDNNGRRTSLNDVQIQAQQIMRQGVIGAQDLGRQYATVFTDVTRRSPFELWPREALIDLLILTNIELRNEEDLHHYQLVNICNQLFAGKPMPSMPPPMPAEIREKAENAASRIQRLWILRQREKRQQEMVSKNESDRVLSDGVIAPPGAVNDPSKIAMCPTPTSATREIEMEWIRPDVGLAKEYAEFNHPRVGGPGGDPFPIKKTTAGRYCVLGGCGEQLDLWDEGQVSELALFGSGITNYFKFEKWCAWTFLILFIIYIPQIIINTFGGGAVTFSSYTDIAKTSLGNLVTALNGTDAVVIPYCDHFSTYFHVLDCTIDKAGVAMMYTYIDIAGCIFVFIAFLWMKSFQKDEADHLDRHTVTASDYTIKIKRLPPHVSETDIKVLFARALNIPVAQVALGYNNAEEIEQYQLRGVLVKRRNYVVNRFRYINSLKQKFKAGQMWYMSRELPYLQSRNEALLKQIDRLDKQLHIAGIDTKPLCAFVTFNTQENFVQALTTYKFSLWKYIFMPKQLRLKGYRITVNRAPEPSLILWENLQYSRLDRFGRKLCTTFIAASLICISIILAFVARYYQNQNRHTDAVCPSEWESLSPTDQRHSASNNFELLGCYCSQATFVYQLNDSVCKVYVQKQVLAIFWTLFASFSVVVINYLIQLGLERMTKFEKYHSLDQQQLEISLRIFVLKFINTGCVILLLNNGGVQESLGLHVSDQGNFTAEWYLTTGLSLMIVMAINIIGPLAPSLYYYYLTVKAQRKAEVGETEGFLTQEEMNNVFMGPEFQVSLRYATNLVTFFVCYIYASAMPILLFFGAASFFAGYWVDKYLFLRYYRIPPQYGRELSRGVVNTIQYAFLCHLIISMWSYSQDNVFTSQDDSTPVGDYVTQYSHWLNRVHSRVTKINIVPLLLAFLAVLAFMISRQLFNGVAHFFGIIISFLTCRRYGVRKKDGVGEINCIDVTYQRAVDRGLIKGLHTYNILQNPKYKEAFAISDQFAATHTHIESIRGHLCDVFDDEEGEGGSDYDNEADIEAPAPPLSRVGSPASGGERGSALSPRSVTSSPKMLEVVTAVTASSPPRSPPPMTNGGQAAMT